MGREAIVERILQDARAEAEEILSKASALAEKTLKEAEKSAEAEKSLRQKEIKERVSSILEGRAAAARLDSKKIVLFEERRTIDEIYLRALEKLRALSKEESLALFETLLKRYAEEGETVVLSRDFPCESEAKELSIFKEKNLSLSSARGEFEGGFLLLGKRCDKDVSYRTLLEEDREAHESELYEKLFGERS